MEQELEIHQIVTAALHHLYLHSACAGITLEKFNLFEQFHIVSTHLFNFALQQCHVLLVLEVLLKTKKLRPAKAIVGLLLTSSNPQKWQTLKSGIVGF